MIPQYKVLDIETTIHRDDRNKIVGSCWSKLNKLVLYGQLVPISLKDWMSVDAEDVIQILEEEPAQPDTDILVVGHNLKFDLGWLRFRYGWDISRLKIWDTMVYEYLKAGGLDVELNLAACCRRYGIEAEHKDFLKEVFASGLNTDTCDRPALTEYLRKDLISTNELFKRQWEETYGD